MAWTIKPVQICQYHLPMGCAALPELPHIGRAIILPVSLVRQNAIIGILLSPLPPGFVRVHLVYFRRVADAMAKALPARPSPDIYHRNFFSAVLPELTKPRGLSGPAARRFLP